MSNGSYRSLARVSPIRRICFALSPEHCVLILSSCYKLFLPLHGYRNIPFADSGPCDPLLGNYCWISSYALYYRVPKGATKLSIWSGEIFYSRPTWALLDGILIVYFTYSQRASGFEVCLPINRSFATYTIMTRLVYTGLLGLLSAIIVSLHNHSNEMEVSDKHYTGKWQFHEQDASDIPLSSTVDFAMFMTWWNTCTIANIGQWFF